MIHPLLHLLATKPHLVGDHLGAYADLIGAEVQKTSKTWTSRVIFYVAAVFLLTTGLMFTGVALMLWAVVPAANMNSLWLLVIVPLVPLIGGACCIFRARARPAQSAFETVKEQFTADMAMLHDVSAAT